MRFFFVIVENESQVTNSRNSIIIFISHTHLKQIQCDRLRIANALAVLVI